MPRRFRVDQIDHVEVFVPDRREAARWYAETLGLEEVENVGRDDVLYIWPGAATP